MTTAVTSDRALERPYEGRAPRLWIALGLALAAAIALLGAGASRPLEEHEVFVARTATEMQRSGEWLLPSFNGTPRLEKPALAYWAAAAAHRALGGAALATVGERAARLPAALAGLALIWVAFELARLAFRDRRAGFVAAAMWATSQAFFAYTRNARPEMLHALFCGLAMVGFARLVRREGGRRANWLFAWTSLALALVAKAPFLPAFIVIGSVVALWSTHRRDPAAPGASVLRPWSGLGWTVAIAGAYFALVAWRVPGATAFWRHQMFDRTGGASEAGLSFLTLPMLWSTAPMLAPWLFALPLAAVLAWRSRDAVVRVLAFSVVAALLFLSCSRRTHAYYALPVLPFACALMAGAAVAYYDRWRGTTRLQRTIQVHAAFAVIGSVAVVVYAFANAREASQVEAVVLVLGCATAIAASWLTWSWARARTEQAFFALCAAFGAISAACAVGHVGAESERFSKSDFAKEVSRKIAPDVPIVRESGSLELLVYYGDRRVDDVAQDQLGTWIAAHPTGLVLARNEDLVKGLVHGRVLIAENAPPHRDPMVLVEPTR